MSLSLLGKAKEFASLSNLKSTSINEGFVDITIHYMGELWVLLEFNSKNSKSLFHENVGVKSWFSKLTQASNDFITEGILDSSKRSPWVVLDFLEEYDEEDLSDDGSRDVDSKKKNLETCGDDNDLEEVQETVFVEKGESNHNVDENSSRLKENHSEDPFAFTPNEESDTLDMNKEDNSSKMGHTGFSGGILCVWDCNSYCKANVNASDSLILIRGVWLKTSNDLLIVAVYAPQDLGEKRRLWDYLVHVIQKWHDEVVIIGDFNEVRFKSNRFGLVFNSQGANAFNSFIANARFEEIPLGGSAFTWCHKSATKMSKLDRFLISENLLSKCPNITAVTLDRYLSDHRPILLRESQFDCGPIPFRFFHHWFDVDGFNKIVEDAWCEAPGNESNAMLNLTKKLKGAKKAIWVCGTKKSLGPDGFTFGFYRRFWKIIESDVFEAIKQFFTLGKFPKGCNSCFIALILKIPDANLVKDFRPISLIGSLYKIIAKILANRLVGVLGDIVDEVQYAFIADRQILDGLRINMSKSKINRVLVDREKIRCATAKLGCLILKLPFSYLGTQVGGTMSRVQAWNDVVDKVLGLIPIFHMSIFRVPLGVLRLQESTRSHFFNGHVPNSKKASWVKWNNVMASKEKGGLGVASLYAMNREDGKVGKVDHSGSRSCWLDIVHEINVLEKQGIKLLDHMKVKLGNRDKVIFLEDTWNGDKTFKDLYPRIYALESLKLVSVGMKLSLDSSFRRKPRGGIEQEQFDALADHIRDVILAPTPDIWVWSLEKSGVFSFASIRKMIDDKSLSEVATKTRWIKVVPIKVNVYAWKVKNDYLLTRFNISRCGIDIASIMCPFCSNGVETSSHLFFSCNLARTLTRRIIQWWDISDEEFNAYEEWFSWIVNIRLPSKKKMMLEGIFYSMWWHLWSFRNKFIFDNKIPTKVMLFDDIVSRTFY
nr:RNA-directed DNA polymerase, eukaryota [Tanacetum cinerariifolium]